MSEDNSIIKEGYENFIKEICESEIIWALEKEEGFATATSLSYEDDEGEPVEVLCFWSSKALAETCAKDDWSGYKPVEIPLSDFIENWCVGMSNDLIMAGTDFDEELTGYEADPLELIVVLAEVLKELKKDIPLQNHNHIDDLVAEVNKIMGE
jgi:hypothetical protein